MLFRSPHWYLQAVQANLGDPSAREVLHRQNIHVSETAWVGTHFDYELDNNGTIEELYTQMKSIIQWDPEPTSTGFYKPLADNLSTQS